MSSNPRIVCKVEKVHQVAEQDDESNRHISIPSTKNKPCNGCIGSSARRSAIFMAERAPPHSARHYDRGEQGENHQPKPDCRQLRYARVSSPLRFASSSALLLPAVSNLPETRGTRRCGWKCACSGCPCRSRAQAQNSLASCGIRYALCPPSNAITLWLPRDHPCAKQAQGRGHNKFKSGKHPGRRVRRP